MNTEIETPAAEKSRPMWQRILTAALSCLPAIVLEVLAIIASTNLYESTDLYCILALHISALVALLAALLGRHSPLWLRWITVAVSPFCSYMATECLSHSPFDMDVPIILLNIFLFYITAAAVMFIFGRTAPAVITVAVLPLILSVISYYTTEFRGSPLFPWDLASYGVAASVVGEYTIVIRPIVALVIGSAVLICTVAAVMNVRVRFPLRPVRPICAVVLSAFAIGSGIYVQTDRAISDFSLYSFLFTPSYLYEYNGFTVSFLMNMRYTTVPKPAGYSRDGLTSLSSEYSSDNTGDLSDTEKLPNIIAIMNESFSDLSVLGDFETSEPYMPFINSLEENTMKGQLHVSILGGNTPNSEFEFLTGLSMAYLPSGSIPFQQYISKQSPSLPSQLSSLGYHTVAMHPLKSTGWKRNTVYPLLGFDEMYFTDNAFYNASKIRAYISDESLYDELIDVYESNSDEPLFIFAVTMQNHGGYKSIYNNFVPDVTVSGYEDNEYISNYISLIRESDRAFENLIGYFSECDEPTVVLMFGDHQPNSSVTNPILKAAGTTIDRESLEDTEKNYIVPYVIWSNTELPDTDPGDTSANYLSTLLIEVAGLPKTGAQKFLTELKHDYPIITGRCIVDRSGTYYPSSEYGTDDRLKQYAGMEYSYLFDRKYAPFEMWSLGE